MYIKKLEIEGFKKHKEKIIFNFNRNKETIIGDNATGKSSVGDAIRWLLSGYNFNGNDKNNIKLLNKESNYMRVKALIIVNEKEIIAERLYNINNGTSLSINGKRVSNKYFERYYKNKDIIMANLDMKYIINLSNQKGRNFFMSILPPVKKEEVVKHMKKAKYLPKELKENTEDINKIMKSIREKTNKFKLEESKIKGKIEALKANIKETDLEMIFTKNKELNCYEKKYKGIAKSLEKEIELKDEANKINIEKMNLTEKRKKLLEKYSEIDEIIKSLDNKICPTCKQPIKNVKEKIEKYAEEKVLIIKEGKVVADKIVKVEKNKTKFENDIKKLKNINNSDEIIENMNKLKKEKETVELNNAAIKTIVENNIKFSKDITMYEEVLENLIKQKMAAEYQIEALKEYNIVHTSMQVNKLQIHFDKVSVNLFKYDKEGNEIKETYEVLYEGNEEISRSEKVKAGVEIANVIQKVTNINLPMFVDNIESINKIICPKEKQIIISKFVVGKKIQIIKKDEKAA